MAEARSDNCALVPLRPGLLLFAALLGAPLIMTLMLSFYQFDYATGGIQQGFSFSNYIEVLSDSYFHKIFGRTFGVALLVTVVCILIGAPEAYILNRMKTPWKSIFLLIVIGPLLISVIVRTLGWALLFGSQGGISTALQWLGLTDEPVSLMFTMTGMTIALVHVLVPFMVLSVWASLQRLDPQVEDAALTLGASQNDRASPHCSPPGDAGHSLRQPDRVLADRQRLCHALDHRGSAPQGGGDHRLR